MAIFFILQWMNGMKRCGVLRQLANAPEGHYIAIVSSSAQITVWWQEGLVCFAHKISIYLDLLHNFAEPWSTWCFTEHQGHAAPPCPSQLPAPGEGQQHLLLTLHFPEGRWTLPEKKDKVRSKCCRHSMKIYLALRSTTPEKVQNYQNTRAKLYQ